MIAAKAKVMVVVAHHVVRLKVQKEIQSTILDGDHGYHGPWQPVVDGRFTL